jgi:hypothetical protein
MGRGFSVLNSSLFNHNATLKQLTGVIYSFGAVLRIVTAIVDTYRLAQEVLQSLQIKKIASMAAETAAVNILTASYIALGIASGGVSYGATTVTGTFGKVVGSIMGSKAGGGNINQSGLYMLHKGEHVIPKGASTNIININMQSGPISNSIDVDNMLNAMASRMTAESRRRGVS